MMAWLRIAGTWKRELALYHLRMTIMMYLLPDVIQPDNVK
jgi:hypothetical protein